MPIDKKQLVAKVRAKIEEEIAQATRIAKDAADAVTHADNRPENDKDMRSTEASYVARGHAARVRSLEQALATLASMPVKTFGAGDAIQLGALVEVAPQGATKELFFLVVAAGGMRVEIDGREVQTLATQSPLGTALLGLSKGDEAELTTPKGKRVYEIVAVS